MATYKAFCAEGCTSENGPPAQLKCTKRTILQYSANLDAENKKYPPNQTLPVNPRGFRTLLCTVPAVGRAWWEALFVTTILIFETLTSTLLTYI